MVYKQRGLDVYLFLNGLFHAVDSYDFRMMLRMMRVASTVRRADCSESSSSRVTGLMELVHHILIKLFTQLQTTKNYQLNYAIGYTRRYRCIQIVSLCLTGSLNMHFIRPWVPKDYSIFPLVITKVPLVPYVSAARLA